MRGNEIEIFKSAGRDLVRQESFLVGSFGPVIIIETKARSSSPASKK